MNLRPSGYEPEDIGITIRTIEIALPFVLAWTRLPKFGYTDLPITFLKIRKAQPNPAKPLK